MAISINIFQLMCFIHLLYFYVGYDLTTKGTEGEAQRTQR